MSQESDSLRDGALRALQAGQISEAEGLVVKALTLSPTDANARALYGIILSQLARHDEASRELLNAVRLEPANVGVCFNLGVVLERAGNREAAAGAYRRVLELDASHGRAGQRLAAMAPQPPPPPPPSPDPGRTVVGMPSPALTQPLMVGDTAIVDRLPGGAQAPPAAPAEAAPWNAGPPPVLAATPITPAAPTDAAPWGAGSPPAWSFPQAPTAGSIDRPSHLEPGASSESIPASDPYAYRESSSSGRSAAMGGSQSTDAPSRAAQSGNAYAHLQVDQAPDPSAGWSTEPDGLVECARCGGSSSPGTYCQLCSAPLPPPSWTPEPRVVAPPPLEPVDDAPGTELPNRFNPFLAVVDWFRVLVSPRAFFEDQARSTGFLSPNASMLLMAIVVAVASGSGIGRFVSQAAPAGNTLTGAALAVPIALGGICSWPMLMLVYLLEAACVHWPGRWFGSQGEFSQSYRVVVYGTIPAMLGFAIMMTLLWPSLSPDQIRALMESSRTRRVTQSQLPLDAAPNQPSPPRWTTVQYTPGAPPPGVTPGGDRLRDRQIIAEQLNAAGRASSAVWLVGGIWSLVLIVIGLIKVHQLPIGGAIGAVVLGGVFYILIGMAIGFVLAILSAGLLAGLAGMARS